ncbi:hypothetical protein TanjilG_14795 [Lupinus angustifolius]|uniref:Pre-rRNA-processing protein TSR2 homolog n=1 Tax=Lupinus angustifolius TaxID=3871 RepID=A0A1J7GHU9_LUPAN|nr:hypothetical protein TanjilG_14795 [Lupinus angustifolius]
MDGGMRRLQGESISMFNEGIGLILYRWSALRTAVENEWGGRESRLKAEQLAADLLSWFTQSKAMLSINVEVDDGSIEEVAENLMVMHEEFLDGNFTSIANLREANLKQSAHPHVTQIVNDDEDDEEEDGDNEESIIRDDNSSNMNVDIPKYESNVNSMNGQVSNPLPTVSGEANDGWIAVSNRRNKVRKN